MSKKPLTNGSRSSDASKHWHACLNDGDSTRLNEANHEFEWIIDVEPTVEAEGSKHEECKICNYKKTAVSIDKLKDTSGGGDDNSGSSDDNGGASGDNGGGSGGNNSSGGTGGDNGSSGGGTSTGNNTGNAGNGGNTGDNGNAGNVGNTGDTGNTGNNGDKENIGGTGDTGNTGAEDSKPVNNSKPVDANDGSKVTTTSKGEAAVAEVKKTNSKSITVPLTTKVDGVKYNVTTINAYAFKNATKAKTVTLPNTITKIKANAFASSKIETVKITIKKGGKLSIDKKAFKKSNVKKVQVFMNKKATKKEKNAVVNALKKAGIKVMNIKLKLK